MENPHSMETSCPSAASKSGSGHGKSSIDGSFLPGYGTSGQDGMKWKAQSARRSRQGGRIPKETEEESTRRSSQGRRTPKETAEWSARRSNSGGRDPRKQQIRLPGKWRRADRILRMGQSVCKKINQSAKKRKSLEAESDLSWRTNRTEKNRDKSVSSTLRTNIPGLFIRIN